MKSLSVADIAIILRPYIQETIPSPITKPAFILRFRTQTDKNIVFSQFWELQPISQQFRPPYKMNLYVCIITSPNFVLPNSE